MVSLLRRKVLIFTDRDVSVFLHQENSKLYLFIHELVLLNVQASSHAS
jgi:hypothetical protein